MTFPLPTRMIREFAARVDRLIVIEELDPVIEEEIKLQGIACEGKSIFPSVGELDPEIVHDCAITAGLLSAPAQVKRTGVALSDLPPRPPVLCPGCPHRGIYVIARKMQLLINGDIGCYTLGSLPPLSAVHTTGCMGAGIGQAHGVAMAGIKQKHVAVIGDSTFFHSGIPALLNAAYNKSNTTTIILDNRTTAMTGHHRRSRRLCGRVLPWRGPRSSSRGANVRCCRLLDGGTWPCAWMRGVAPVAVCASIWDVRLCP